MLLGLTVKVYLRLLCGHDDDCEQCHSRVVVMCHVKLAAVFILMICRLAYIHGTLTPYSYWPLRSMV